MGGEPATSAGAQQEAAEGTATRSAGPAAEGTQPTVQAAVWPPPPPAGMYPGGEQPPPGAYGAPPPGYAPQGGYPAPPPGVPPPQGGYAYPPPPQGGYAYQQPATGYPQQGTAIYIPPVGGLALTGQGYVPPPGYGAPQPIGGLPIRPPPVPPAPGQVVVGYQVVKPHAGCCECGTLNATGMISLVILLLFFWPLAFIPCVMEDCHESYQVATYGYPAPPVAPPVQGSY